MAVFLAVVDLLVPEGRVRGAVRFTAGLVMLIVMLEPVMLLLNGGFTGQLTAVGNGNTWSRWADALPVQVDVEQVVRQGEAVWQAGWQPVVAAAATWLDEQLAWEVRDRFGETAGVETELADDGTPVAVKVILMGPAREGVDEADIQRWVATRLRVVESRVTVARDTLLAVTPLEEKAWPTASDRAEVGGSWDE